VLGGYDRGRIQAKSTATFGISNQTNELLVNVAAININWNDEPPASSPANVFPAVIDSTLPYMELPTQVCDFFAEKFNLTEDNGTNIYFANSGIADTNSRRTSSISFVLQDAYHGSGQTTITFPYDAFNSTLHWSWGNSEPRIIFPMRKMNKTAVLGRAFLQEAYLFANYEPDNMTLQLSQTVHDNPSSNIVSVYSSRHVVLSPSRKLKGGAIAGIVIGVVAIVALVALALWWFVRHRKNKKKEAAVEDTVAEKDGTSATVKHTEGDPDIWPKGAYGAVEVDAVSPSVASSARPGHRRLGSNVSELSSDSEHQKNHTLMGTLHEMPDNPSAAELEGSHRWSNGNDPPSQDSVSPSAQSTPPPKLQSSPASENSLHLPS
jgi:hypothetical protein